MSIQLLIQYRQTELESHTTEIRPDEIKKDALYMILASLLTILVGYEVSIWNPLIDNLLHLSKQLEDLGVIYADGQVTYIEAISRE